MTREELLGCYQEVASPLARIIGATVDQGNGVYRVEHLATVETKGWASHRKGIGAPVGVIRQQSLLSSFSNPALYEVHYLVRRPGLTGKEVADKLLVK